MKLNKNNELKPHSMISTLFLLYPSPSLPMIFVLFLIFVYFCTVLTTSKSRAKNSAIKTLYYLVSYVLRCTHTAGEVTNLDTISMFHRDSVILILLLSLSQFIDNANNKNINKLHLLKLNTVTTITTTCAKNSTVKSLHYQLCYVLICRHTAVTVQILGSYKTFHRVCVLDTNERSRTKSNQSYSFSTYSEQLTVHYSSYKLTNLELLLTTASNNAFVLKQMRTILMICFCLQRWGDSYFNIFMFEYG